ncbi:hypothetical protein J2S66_001785 [Saccharothrix longispora]|uniref:Uncharacterized protein n=1 Tax=Saccharothrix longispora TaxID=33920 RepID=A0ABU1PRX8_9PSEU|nr:hypothetical protein [Saccharothrix longispora]
MPCRSLGLFRYGDTCTRLAAGFSVAPQPPSTTTFMRPAGSRAYRHGDPHDPRRHLAAHRAHHPSWSCRCRIAPLRPSCARGPDTYRRVLWPVTGFSAAAAKLFSPATGYRAGSHPVHRRIDGGGDGSPPTPADLVIEDHRRYPRCPHARQRPGATRGTGRRANGRPRLIATELTTNSLRHIGARRRCGSGATGNGHRIHREARTSAVHVRTSWATGVVPQQRSHGGRAASSGPGPGGTEMLSKQRPCRPGICGTSPPPHP